MKPFAITSLCLAITAAFPQMPDIEFKPEPSVNIAKEIGLDQKLDGQVPLDAAFTDESGNPVTLRQYFGKGPVVMALVYYKCPKLCNQVLNGLLATMRVMKFDVGREFEVVLIGIDPRETSEVAAAKKKSYMESYDRPGAENGWHFLTGQEVQIKRIADAVGYWYRFDEKMNQYVHPAGLMVATPAGKLAQYFYGIEYSQRDLVFAVMEASEERIGSLVDQVVLYCFTYDPASGRYGLVVMRVLRVMGIATVLTLGALVFVLSRRNRGKLGSASKNGVIRKEVAE
ncbi:MAG: SCO family protein [Fimbriimonadales bacterium]